MFPYSFLPFCHRAQKNQYRRFVFTHRESIACVYQRPPDTPDRRQKSRCMAYGRTKVYAGINYPSVIPILISGILDRPSGYIGDALPEVPTSSLSPFSLLLLHCLFLNALCDPSRYPYSLAFSLSLSLFLPFYAFLLPSFAPRGNDIHPLINLSAINRRLI